MVVSSLTLNKLRFQTYNHIITPANANQATLKNKYTKLALKLILDDCDKEDGHEK